MLQVIQINQKQGTPFSRIVPHISFYSYFITPYYIITTVAFIIYLAQIHQACNESSKQVSITSSRGLSY